MNIPQVNNDVANLYQANRNEQQRDIQNPNTRQEPERTINQTAQGDRYMPTATQENQMAANQANEPAAPAANQTPAAQEPAAERNAPANEGQVAGDLATQRRQERTLEQANQQNIVQNARNTREGTPNNNRMIDMMA